MLAPSQGLVVLSLFGAMARYAVAARSKAATTTSMSLLLPRADVTSTASALAVTSAASELLSIAESLISPLYPAVTIPGLLTITLPTTVVIDSSTLTLQHTSATSSPTATSPSSTGSIAETPQSSSVHSSQSSTNLNQSRTQSTRSTTTTTKSRPHTSGFKTFTTEPASTKTSPASNTNTAAASSLTTGQPANDQKDITGDHNLAIIMGVVLGALAVVLMAILFTCLWRRKRNSGSFFLPRRGGSSARSSFRAVTSGSWGDDLRFGDRADEAGVFGGMRSGKEVSTSVVPIEWNRPSPIVAPPLHAHPAFQPRNRESAGTVLRPLVEVEEEEAEVEGDGDSGVAIAREMKKKPRQTSWSGCLALEPHDRAALHHSSLSQSSELSRASSQSHPLTPLLPSPSRRFSRSFRIRRKPVPEEDGGEARRSRTWTVNSEFGADEETSDLITPVAPAKSPARSSRHSGQIHYPSWGEVSEFDFTTGGSSSPPRGEQERRGWA